MISLRGIIIASGEIRDLNWLKQYLRADDLIVCADGGYNYLAAIHVLPHVIVGDMDSIHEEHWAACKHFVYPRKKDETDAQLALDYAIEQGCSEVCFLGATGGQRVEHEIANILMLQYAALKQVAMRVENESSSIMLYQGPCEITVSGRKGDYLSLIPLGEDAQNVTTYDLEYPLLHGTLIFGVPMGISNVLLENTCRITMEKGKLLVILTKADEVDGN